MVLGEWLHLSEHNPPQDGWLYVSGIAVFPLQEKKLVKQFILALAGDSVQMVGDFWATPGPKPFFESFADLINLLV
jgi:hypothetical protein